MAWAKIFADFSGWTSAHGLPHIGRSTTTCLRVFWTIMFLVSACIFGYQTYLLISRYIRFEVVVNTALKSEERVFPAITVCNINPFKASAITPEIAPEMAEVLYVYREMLMGNKSADPGDKYGFHRYDVTFPNSNGTERTNTTALVALQRRAREHLLLIGAQYNLTNPERMKAVTYPIEEMVESCSYGPQPPLPGVRTANGTSYGSGSDYITCSRADFKPTYDTAYGLCYTFNDPPDGQDPLNSSFAGPRYGLRLILRSDQAEYLELTESAGMRIAVHEQGQEAFVDAFGYNAAAGFTTSFSIKYIHTTREGPPYGNCSKDGGTGDKYYKGAYSVEGCYRSCLQNEIKKRCGCADPRYNSPTDWPMCDYQQMGCLAQFSVGVEAAVEFQPSRQCNCPQICSESTYGVTVASATWPSQSFQVPNGMAFGLDSPTRPKCKPTKYKKWLGWRPEQNRELMKPCQEWYQQNTMNLEIYWERLNYQELSEKPAYTPLSLLSDFGGQAGLWLGVSVITFVEIISLLLLLCLYCCKRGSLEDEAAEEAKSERRDSASASDFEDTASDYSDNPYHEDEFKDHPDFVSPPPPK